MSQKDLPITFKDHMSMSIMDGWVSYQGKGIEICFEPCLNGCDVAVYDDKQSLLEPKFCTDLDNFGFGDKATLMIKAFEKAQEFFNKYAQQND